VNETAETYNFAVPAAASRVLQELVQSNCSTMDCPRLSTQIRTMRKIIARQNMAIAAAFRVQSYEMTEDQILHSNKIETLVFNRTVKDRML
jgi:hypothetical protein